MVWGGCGMLSREGAWVIGMLGAGLDFQLSTVMPDPPRSEEAKPHTSATVNSAKMAGCPLKA